MPIGTQWHIYLSLSILPLSHFSPLSLSPALSLPPSLPPSLIPSTLPSISPFPLSLPSLFSHLSLPSLHPPLTPHINTPTIPSFPFLVDIDLYHIYQTSHNSSNLLNRTYTLNQYFYCERCKTFYLTELGENSDSDSLSEPCHNMTGCSTIEMMKAVTYPGDVEREGLKSKWNSDGLERERGERERERERERLCAHDSVRVCVCVCVYFYILVVLAGKGEETEWNRIENG